MSTPEHRHNPPVGRDVGIGVVGATGAVGPVTLDLLRDRGYENVRAFASARSAGKQLGGLTVEEATPEALSAGDLDLCLFSIGTAANGERALEHDGIVANPNCASIPLTCVLKPLHVAVGLARVRLATYQSASGAGTERMERLRAQDPAEGDLAMDWEFDGEEFDEESKLRAETRKILELPELPVSATCVRVPVMVGHAESVWIETVEPISPEQAREVLSRAPGVRLDDF